VWEILRGFLEGSVGHIFANIIINYGPIIMTTLIALWMRYNKKHFWLLPLMIGISLSFIIMIVDRFVPRPIPRPTMVTAELHAIVPPVTVQGTGTVSGPSVVLGILVFVFWFSAIVLVLYVSKKWSWPFKWPWGMISLREVSQKLYDDLIISNMANSFKRLFVDSAYPANKTHDYILDVLARYLAEENITLHGKPPFSTKSIEIINLQLQLGSMEFKDGATSLCFFASGQPEFTQLSVKKGESKRAIKRVIVKMQYILTPTTGQGVITETKKPTAAGSILEIGKAQYWTAKEGIDVTEELKKMIVDNKLETIASNDIKGDPDVGTVKTLSIEYKCNGVTLRKDFTEGERVVIP
jgi:hypothetical protein